MGTHQYQSKLIEETRKQAQQHVDAITLFQNFIQNMTLNPLLTPSDKSLFKELQSQFDDHLTHLTTLRSEFAQFYTYDPHEQTELFELTSTIFTNTHQLILSIPHKISQTHIAQKMDISIPSVQDLALHLPNDATDRTQPDSFN